MGKAKEIVCVMHVPYEGPGIITAWAKRKGIPVKYVKLYEKVTFPDLEPNDLLLIMGGPMNVYDFHVHPWMEEEVEWVWSIIKNGNPVLGICLGAQIIAAALGADVYPGAHKEIGWHQLQFLPSTGDFKIWDAHPGTPTVFQWHRDTFDIPEKAVRIASSAAFQNQGFIYKGNIVALQFHLEVNMESISDLIENCRKDIVPGPYVQDESEILSISKPIETNRRLMTGLMEWMMK